MRSLLNMRNDLTGYLPIAAALVEAGLPVHHATVARWCIAGRVPALRIGSRWHVKPDDLRAAAVRTSSQL